MIIKSRLSDEELIQFICKAAYEYQKLLGKTYLVVGKNKESEYFWFQCSFEKKQFMHLLGIKSKSMQSDEFYEKCVYGEGISISDCTPSRNHSRTTINEKASCCADMLKISDAKYMKVGIKDKISQYVDFKYAYGNSATLGFQIKESGISFPITLIPRNIDEFSSTKYKIIFVFEKVEYSDLYDRPMMEIKKGLLEEKYDELPEALKELVENPICESSDS